MSGYPQINRGRYGIGLVTGQFYPHSFDFDALDTFQDFVAEHSRCIWYDEIAHESVVDTNAIAIRHDVDHSIVHAYRFAKWEAEHGINASYYILPTAPYFDKEETFELALAIQALGHEIGVHNDAHCEAQRRAVRAGEADKLDASMIAMGAIEMLWVWTRRFREAGLFVSGCADHGGGEPSNTDMWRKFGYVPSDAELSYECYHLHARPGVNYISDNRGMWRSPLEKIEGKQSHVLIHPEHWRVP